MSEEEFWIGRGGWRDTLRETGETSGRVGCRLSSLQQAAQVLSEKPSQLPSGSWEQAMDRRGC